MSLSTPIRASHQMLRASAWQRCLFVLLLLLPPAVFANDFHLPSPLALAVTPSVRSLDSVTDNRLRLDYLLINRERRPLVSPC